jgi:hypothetical protein
MFLPLVTRPNILININSVANNVNLRARANSPSYPLNVFCLINANITSNSANISALRTGFGWANSTYIVIRNSANIVGNIGVTGISGSGGAGGPGAGYPTNPVAPGSAGGTGGVGANGSPGFQAEANTSNVGIINYSSNSNTFVSNANTNWIGTNSSWTWGVSGDNLEGGGSLGTNIRTTIYYNFDINANVPFTLEYKLVSASSANAAGTVGIYRTQDQGNIGSTSGNFYAAGMFSATSTHWVGGVDPAPTVGLAIVHSAASADVVQEKGANVHSLTSNVSAANVFSLVREIDGVLKVYRDGVLLKTHPESAAGNMRFVVNSTSEGNFLRLDYLKLHQYPYTFPGTNATSFVIVMNNQGSIIGGTGGPGGQGGGGGGGGGALGFTPSKGVGQYHGGGGGGGGAGSPIGLGGAGGPSNVNGSAGANGTATLGGAGGAGGGGSTYTAGPGGSGGNLGVAGSPGGNNAGYAFNTTYGARAGGAAGATGNVGNTGFGISGNNLIRFVAFGTVVGNTSN